MANLLPKSSSSTTPTTPVTPEKVVANFTVATSQLLELIGDCKDNCKKGVELSHQLNGVEDRITTLEQKVSTLPHPPHPPAHQVATTADLGKAMATVKDEYTKEIQELKKQIASILIDIKGLRDEREPIVKELFTISNNADNFRNVLRTAISVLVKGVSDVFKKLETQIGETQTITIEKK